MINILIDNITAILFHGVLVFETFTGVETLVSSDSVNVENFFLIMVSEAMDTIDGLTEKSRVNSDRCSF